MALAMCVLAGSRAEAGWWNFGKSELQNPADAPGGPQAEPSGRIPSPYDEPASSTGNYAARQPENPSKSSGFTFKFPWSKKTEEPETVQDPFGAATLHHGPETTVQNQAYQGHDAAPVNAGSDAAYDSRPSYADTAPAYARDMQEHPTFNPDYGIGQPSQSHPPVGTAVPVQPLYRNEEMRMDFPSPHTPPRVAPEMQADSTAMAGEQIRVFAQGKTLAWVGTTHILAADIIYEVDLMLLPYKDKIPPAQYQQEHQMQCSRLLERAIEDKLVYCDLLRSMPAEQVAKFQEAVARIFETKELPDRIKKSESATREEYDAKLRQLGTSIARQREAYCEGLLRQQWLQQNIQQNYDVSHAEMLDYYHAHAKDYENHPRACWEELVINKNRFAGREEAYREIARLGTLVYTQRMTFEQVAKEFSHGVTAADGGKNNWIRPGELASRELDQAIFTQPEGVLSPSILEDAENFYIIRVTRREERHLTPFVEVQAEIRDKIKEQKFDESLEKYVTKIKKEIPVTRADDAPPTMEEIKELQRRQQAQAQGGGLGGGMSAGGFGF